MVYLLALLTVAAFVWALRLFGVVPAATKAVGASREALECMRSQTLTEFEKERRLRGASLTLIANFVSISIRGALALLVSLLPSLAGEATGLAPASEVTDLLLSWEAIVAIGIVMAVAPLFRSKRTSKG